MPPRKRKGPPRRPAGTSPIRSLSGSEVTPPTPSPAMGGFSFARVLPEPSPAMDDLAAAVAEIQGQAPIRLDQTSMVAILVRRRPLEMIRALLQLDDEVLAAWCGPPLSDDQLGRASTAKLLYWIETLGVVRQSAECGGRA
jgi:hypothetical protein